MAPVFDLGVGMDPEISGFENIIIRGLFLGQTRKQMLAKVDEIAEFTELGDYLSMPLRTYSTGMRVRLAMGVVTSIDPEILLLDEGIGAVDAEFLKKAQTRLQGLVERSGILVFASHSNEFLARLCKTAMWIDHGTIKMTGGIEEVVRAYEGEDAARHVREVLEENAAPMKRTDELTPSVAVRGHPPASRRTGQVAGRADHPEPRAGPPHRRRQRRRRAGARSGCRPADSDHLPRLPPKPRRRRRFRARHAARTGRWAPTGSGWPTTTDARTDRDVLATLLACADKHALAEVSPMVCDLDDPDRLAFPLRRGLVWRRRVSELRTDGAGSGPAAGHRVAVQRRAVPRVHAGGRRRAGPAAVHPRRRGGTAPPAGPLRPAVRHLFGRGLSAPCRDPTSSSRSSAAGCTPSTPTTPTKRYFTYRNRGYLLSQPGMRKLLPQEWLRFGWFFLVSRRDPRGPAGVGPAAPAGQAREVRQRAMTFTDAAAQSRTMSRALA